MDLATRAHTARTLLKAGFVRLEPPRTAVRSVRALRRWGPTLAAGVTTSAIRQPDRPAIVDELGTLTWREVHERSNAIARGLAAAGVARGRRGDPVPQPPRLRRGDAGLHEARRRRAVPQHDVRRAADRGGRASARGRSR